MNNVVDKPLTSRAILLLLSIFTVRGVILASALPPFEGWDEYQHVGYIDYCAHHTAPAVYQQTYLDPDFIRKVVEYPLPHDAALQLSAADYKRYWAAGINPPVQLSPVILYQAQHPCLYYRLMVPIYDLCGGRQNLRLAVSVLRLINLSFGTISLWLVLSWIRKSLVFSLPCIAACSVTFQPLLLLNVIRVANDALAFMLGTAVVVLCLSVCRANFKSRMIRVAIILPFAILSKVTNLTLLPFVAAACFIPPVPKGWKVIAVFAIVTLFAVTTEPYFAFNLNHFGLITPMQEAVANHQAGRSWVSIASSPPMKMWAIWSWCLWIRNALWVGGWSFLQPPKAVVACYEITMGLGLICLSVELFGRKISTAVNQLMLVLLLLALMHAGLMYHEMESFSATAGRASANPWYAAVAIPWWMILICVALGNAPLSRAGRMAALSLPILQFTTEAFGTIFRMIPSYYCTSSLGVFQRRLSMLHPYWLAFPTMTVSIAILVLLLASLATNCFTRKSRCDS